ncbi:MAG TPA: hypothetical protein PLU35_06830 [Phycisphaerales bacterium]|nr:hypothetical protein [Phycisphaerales bacterium]
MITTRNAQPTKAVAARKARRVGRARPDQVGVEALEGRVLLSDHADFPDFGNATELTLNTHWNGYTLTASASGVVDHAADTDLFTFVPPFRMDISVAAVVQSIVGELAPRIEFRGSDGALLLPVADGIRGVAFVAPDFDLQAGERYFIVVAAGTPSDQWEMAATGSYLLFISMDKAGGRGTSGGEDQGDDQDGGQQDGDDVDSPPPPPADDYADDGEWNDAHSIALDDRTGNAQLRGGLQTPDDTDLFSITAPATGPVRVQVSSHDAGLRLSLRVFNQNGIPFASERRDLPGASSTVEFVAGRDERYFVLVEGPGNRTGDYTLKIDAEPSLHYLWYPEGYSSPTIDEHVPLVNPNSFPVNYTIYARYEVGERDQVLAMGTLLPRSRGGITINSRLNPGGSLTREGVPYALEIVSDGRIGATLSHYDFGVTTGENFTDVLSREWSFAEARRDPEAARDLLVFYNPNSSAARVEITLLYEHGIPATFVRTIDGLRRGGVNFNDDGAVPRDGVFGVVVKSDLPIVAALTSYDIARARGDGLLGVPDGGATHGVVPLLSAAEGVDSSISILNASSGQAAVLFKMSYPGGERTEHSKVIRVEAKQRMTLTPDDLGVPAGHEAAIMYQADRAVTVTWSHFRNGDGDMAPAAWEASRTLVFGDAFVNALSAGTTYIEELTIFNPSSAAASAQVTILFSDGRSSSSVVEIGSSKAARVRVDQMDVVLAEGGPSAFSIRIDSTTPLVASFVHYDLYLDGGWGTLGSPFGLRELIGAV